MGARTVIFAGSLQTFDSPRRPIFMANDSQMIRRSHNGIFTVLRPLAVWGAAAFLWLSLMAPQPAEAQRPAPACKAPSAVCQASARVFVVSSFDPMGSAVLIEPDLLVTSRHVVADNPRAQITLSDGSKRIADVVPTTYSGDLILLRLEGLMASRPLTTATAETNQQVYTVGADVGRGTTRAYLPGRVVAVPPDGKPFARVHHSARSQPGNSGGALFNRDGDLVAIVASGGEGRNEAIPVAEIEKLKIQSGPEQALPSARIGLAYRKCAEALDATRGADQRMAPSNAEFLYTQCLATGNRQMFDDAGRALGRQQFLDQALDLFQRSLDQDPNAVNARLSLAISLHVAQRYEEEIPHLEHLMTALPSDPQVLRLAIQAGKWGGNDALADKAFALLVEHHPQLKPVAERFMKQPPPPRRGVPK